MARSTAVQAQHGMMRLITAHWGLLCCACFTRIFPTYCNLATPHRVNVNGWMLAEVLFSCTTFELFGITSKRLNGKTRADQRVRSQEHVCSGNRSFCSRGVIGTRDCSRLRFSVLLNHSCSYIFLPNSAICDVWKCAYFYYLWFFLRHTI